MVQERYREVLILAPIDGTVWVYARRGESFRTVTPIVQSADLPLVALSEIDEEM